MIKTEQFGPWALVTGASSGIGAGFALHLAQRGINLVLTARRGDDLRQLATELERDFGISTRVIPLDIAAEGSVGVLREKTRDLDIGLVISNAGAGRPGAFLGRSREQLHYAVSLNALSHVDLVHAFGPALVARGRAGIILVAALGAIHGIPNMAIDSAAKGLVRNLGEALHHEFAPLDVRVLTIMPGAVDTPIIDLLGFQRSDLPFRPQSVERAVAESMRALERNRMTLVPGFLVRNMMRLLPRATSIRMNGRVLGEAAKNLDAIEAAAFAIAASSVSNAGENLQKSFSR